MKKISFTLAAAGMFVLGTTTASAAMLQEEAAAEASKGFTQVLKEQFIQGGPAFMGVVLLCLILGLAVAIERIIYLNLASTNTAKLKQQVEDALASGGVEAAKEVCRNTKGPVASIFYQGLDRDWSLPKKRLLPMEVFKWDSWRKMFPGCRCSSPLPPCLGSWVR